MIFRRCFTTCTCFAPTFSKEGGCFRRKNVIRQHPTESFWQSTPCHAYERSCLFALEAFRNFVFSHAGKTGRGGGAKQSYQGVLREKKLCICCPKHSLSCLCFEVGSQKSACKSTQLERRQSKRLSEKKVCRLQQFVQLCCARSIFPHQSHTRPMPSHSLFP